MMESEGMALGANPSPDDVAAQWSTIADMSGAKEYFTLNEGSQRMMTKVAERAAKG
jgi:hypothetical protein